MGMQRGVPTLLFLMKVDFYEDMEVCLGYSEGSWGIYLSLETKCR